MKYLNLIIFISFELEICLLGMPFYLRTISYSMPMTYPIESLRCIFSKGWGVNEFDVYAGIVISTIWILGLIILCLIVTRFRKYSS